MSEFSQDDGVIIVLLQRMETQRLPRALKLKEKVDAGEQLADTDITFLKEVFTDASRIKPLIDRHPEYHDMVTRVLSLYTEITEKALENEKKGV
jgi:hypothetical protein